MTDKPFKIIIVGGGTAGWLSAAFLSQQLPMMSGRDIQITLVEASDIPTVGVGEATVPSLRETLAACGISEIDFLTSCGATFKHGIKFVNWRQPPKENSGESYFHPFGAPLKVGAVDPLRAWSKLPQDKRGNIADIFSVQSEMAEMGRAPKHIKDRPYDGALSYAYHLDAGKFAEYLKQRFRAQGVKHIIGKVAEVDYNPSTENISALTLDDGTKLTSDLYIDCTGFAARLINSDKQNPYIDKTDVLFVDKAVTTRLPTKGTASINGYTTCTAQSAGWIWDIVLQNRRGVGHVYSSKYISDAQAKTELASYIGQSEDALETRTLNMRIGYQQHQWRGNCVAIGLASGFLEPLESTSIHLIQEGITALIELFPDKACHTSDADEYNRRMDLNFDRVRDFLLLHYVATQRDDSPMWNYFRNMVLPESLQEKIDAWNSRGYILRYEQGVFLPPSWVAVMMGQNLLPRGYDRRTDTMDFNDMFRRLAAIKDQSAIAVQNTPDQAAYLSRIGAMSEAPPLTANNMSPI
jgi:tryptophan halogenase